MQTLIKILTLALVALSNQLNKMADNLEKLNFCDSSEAVINVLVSIAVGQIICMIAAQTDNAIVNALADFVANAANA